MKRFAYLAVAVSLAVLVPALTNPVANAGSGVGGNGSMQEPATSEDAFVFADFEHVQDGRPVSNRGGYIFLGSYEQNPANKHRVQGSEGVNPKAPELVRTDRTSPNRSAAFTYEMAAPNDWGGITLEVHGQADKDGKPIPDDVTGYKFLTVDIYTTVNSADTMRVEFVSRGVGINMEWGYPQLSFKIQQGKLRTYKVELNKLSQPPGVTERHDPKDIFKKLTAIQLAVACGPCAPVRGTVVVDNMVLHKK